MGFVLGQSGTCNRGKPVGNGCGYNPHPSPAGIPTDIPAGILGLPAIMSCSRTNQSGSESDEGLDRVLARSVGARRLSVNTKVYRARQLRSARVWSGLVT